MSRFLYPLISWLLSKPQEDALFLLAATECVRASMFISGSNLICPLFSSWAHTRFTPIVQHEWIDNSYGRNSFLPQESKRRQILGLRKPTLVTTTNYNSVSSGRSRADWAMSQRTVLNRGQLFWGESPLSWVFGSLIQERLPPGTGMILQDSIFPGARFKISAFPCQMASPPEENSSRLISHSWNYLGRRRMSHLDCELNKAVYNRWLCQTLPQYRAKLEIGFSPC